MSEQHNDTLDALTGRICNLLCRADDYGRQAKEHAGRRKLDRLAAGTMLLELRQRVDRGEADDGIGWEQYCREHIPRSPGDIRKLLAIAKAGDPHAAADAARKVTREHVKRLRADRAYNPTVSALTVTEASPLLDAAQPKPDPEVWANADAARGVVTRAPALPIERLNAIQTAVKALDTSEFAKFKTWFFTYCGAEAKPTPAPEPVPMAAAVECHSPKGCRYGGCASADRCLAQAGGSIDMVNGCDILSPNTGH